MAQITDIDLFGDEQAKQVAKADIANEKKETNKKSKTIMEPKKVVAKKPEAKKVVAKQPEKTEAKKVVAKQLEKTEAKKVVIAKGDSTKKALAKSILGDKNPNAKIAKKVGMKPAPAERTSKKETILKGCKCNYIPRGEDAKRQGTVGGIYIDKRVDKLYLRILDEVGNATFKRPDAVTLLRATPEQQKEHEKLMK